MRDWLDWPFFESRHRELAARLDAFTNLSTVKQIDHHDVDAACRKLVRGLGDARLLTAAVAPAEGDEDAIDFALGLHRARGVGLRRRPRRFRLRHAGARLRR